MLEPLCTPAPAQSFITDKEFHGVCVYCPASLFCHIGGFESVQWTNWAGAVEAWFRDRNGERQVVIVDKWCPGYRRTVCPR